LRKFFSYFYFINDPVKAAFGDLLFFNAAQFKVFSYEKANFAIARIALSCLKVLRLWQNTGRKSVIKESCFSRTSSRIQQAL
jgi:hypothetical protein